MTRTIGLPAIDRTVTLATRPHSLPVQRRGEPMQPEIPALKAQVRPDGAGAQLR